MLGAIAGDIIGSVYEGYPIKTTKFTLFNKHSRFTDDTVLTIATADCIINNKDFRETYQDYFREYPKVGYGSSFIRWAKNKGIKPYNSWGNGSAMRVSPVGFAYDSLDEVLQKAKKSAEVTHNHPEGIKGAQATAAAIFLARSTKNKGKTREYIEKQFGYNLKEPLDSIKTWYKFDISCQGTVPQAITAFLESGNFEDSIRKVISLGGDSDTLACITGGIAQAFYGDIQVEIVENVYKLLPSEFVDIINTFNALYIDK